MGDRYWVGGTAGWDSTAGTKWATTSGGVGGAAVPTAADDVYFDAASGTVTVSPSAAYPYIRPCRSINFTGFTGTFAMTSGIFLTIGDGTAGAGNIALKFVAGMTVTYANGPTIVFASTNVTQQTVDFANKSVYSVTFNGAGGSWQFTGGGTVAGALIQSAGTLNTNGQTLSIANLTISAGTFNPTTSAITITGTANASVSLGPSATYTANTAVFTLNGNGGGASAQGVNTNGMSLVLNYTGVSNQITGGTWVNVTRTGGANKTAVFQVRGDFTCTGTFTANGNSVTNRLFIYSDSVGTSRTITAATVSCSNVDFMDITGAGAGSWNLSAITGNSGDCGGNTGITFTTSATQTHTTSAGGNWSDATKWTSRAPLPQDDVIVNASTTGTLTVDMPRMGRDLTFTGFAGTLALSGGLSTFTSYGSVTLASGMSFTGAGSFYFAGRGTHAITSATKTWPTHLVLYGYGGTYSLADAIIATGYLAASVSAGTFNSANYTVTIASFSHGLGMTVNFGTSTINLTMTTDNTYIWLIGNGAFPCDASTANVVIASASCGHRSLSIGNTYARRFGSLTYTVANSPGGITLANNFWIDTLTVASGRALLTTTGSTLTVTTWDVDGEVRANDGLVLRSGYTGRYATVPWSAALAPTTEIEIVVRAKATTWSGNQMPIGQSSNAHPTRGFLFYVNASGGLSLLLDDATLNLVSGNSSATLASVGVVSGQTIWFKATWSTTTDKARFFYAIDQPTEPSSWTQLGTDVTLAITAIAPNTNQIIIGSFGANGYQWNGSIYRIILRTMIGGPAVLDADFTTLQWGALTFAESASGATVTPPLSALSEDGAIRLWTPTAGAFATLSVASGSVTSNNISVRDNHATGGATFTAIDSISISGNTGWNFVSGWVPKSIMIM